MRKSYFIEGRSHSQDALSEIQKKISLFSVSFTEIKCKVSMLVWCSRISKFYKVQKNLLFCFLTALVGNLILTREMLVPQCTPIKLINLWAIALFAAETSPVKIRFPCLSFFTITRRYSTQSKANVSKNWSNFQLSFK